MKYFFSTHSDSVDISDEKSLIYDVYNIWHKEQKDQTTYLFKFKPKLMTNTEKSIVD